MVLCNIRSVLITRVNYEMMKRAVLLYEIILQEY